MIATHVKRNKSKITYITKLLSSDLQLGKVVFPEIHSVSDKEASELKSSAVFQNMVFLRGGGEGTKSKDSSICICIVLVSTKSITQELSVAFSCRPAWAFDDKSSSHSITLNREPINIEFTSIQPFFVGRQLLKF